MAARLRTRKRKLPAGLQLKLKSFISWDNCQVIVTCPHHPQSFLGEMGRARQEFRGRIQVAQFLGSTMPDKPWLARDLALKLGMVRRGQRLRCQAVVLRMEASGSPRREFVQVTESSCITHNISNQPEILVFRVKLKSGAEFPVGNSAWKCSAVRQLQGHLRNCSSQQ